MSGFRRNGRKVVRCKVKLDRGNSSETQEIVAETQDLSESGIFLQVRDPDAFNVGECIDATLLSEDEKSSKVSATVVRKTPNGVALTFD